MIEDVEDLGSELNTQLLCNVRVFEDREIDVGITWPTQCVSTQRTEMPRAGNTRPGTSIAGRIKRAWHFERRQINEVVRRARSGVRITDEIGPREKLARVVVIIKQRQVKRIASANRHDRV